VPTLSLRDIWQDLESPVALEPRASARSATRPPRTDNRDPRLVVWNLATGAVELDVPRPVGFNTEHAAVSSDGSLVVCAAHRTQCVLRGHTHRAWCVDVSPDGTWAVSCDDETVRGWDLREAREIVRLEFGVLGVVLRCAVLASGRVLSFMVVLAMSRSCPRCDNPLVPGATRCGKCGMVLAAPRGDPHVGRTVGNLKLTERLGRGGMGSVYRAEHVALGTHYAVKVLHPQFSNDEVLAERFRREAVACSRLRHENIVFVTDFGGIYLVMEYLEGVTLHTVLKRERRLRLARFARMASQLCDAISAAHRLGIVHRDLKPDNVMVLDDPALGERVKVFDFGIAHLREAGRNTGLTAVGSIVGTAAR
jgi:predicted Ser/Thr protein kinase